MNRADPQMQTIAGRGSRLGRFSGRCMATQLDHAGCVYSPMGTSERVVASGTRLKPVLYPGCSGTHPPPSPSGHPSHVDDDAHRDRTAVAYFQRTGTTTFRASEHVGGGWTPREQH